MPGTLLTSTRWITPCGPPAGGAAGAAAGGSGFGASAVLSFLAHEVRRVAPARAIDAIRSLMPTSISASHQSRNPRKIVPAAGELGRRKAARAAKPVSGRCFGRRGRCFNAPAPANLGNGSKPPAVVQYPVLLDSTQL